MARTSPCADSRLRQPVRAMAVGLMATFLIALSFSARASEPLPRALPQDVGIDPAALEAAFDAAGDLGYVQGMVVVRGGAVVGERYYSGAIPGQWFQCRSVTKSVTSTLIGIAIERGFLGGVHDRLVDHLPPDLVPDDPAKHAITLYHLLTMTAGFQWDENADVGDWLYGPDPVGAILARPLVAPPGTVFNYNTAASHLLSVVLTEATGRTTLEFADEVLFGPLGITERRWNLTGGYSNGGHGLYVSTEDLAKLGVLFVGGGRFAERRFVSTYWVNRSTFGDVHNVGRIGPLTDTHYGWLWWLDRSTPYPIFTAIGFGGQLVFCVPALKLVVATHTDSNVPNDQAARQVSDLVGVIVEQLLPAVSDRRLFTVTGVAVPELAAFDDAMRDLMEEHDLHAGQIAIAKDGRLVLAHGYTWDQPEVEPVTPTTLFRIGSISKAVTSVAVHQLIERGLLSYDTPAASTLGLEPPPGQTPDPRLELVTADHLLTHTVGWDKDNGGIDPMVFQDRTVAAALGTEPPPTPGEIATFMAGQPFQFDPGTSWGYCNFGYLLLDMLAEEATGRDFVELVQDDVFRRAGVGRARRAHTTEDELAPGEVTPEGVYEGDPFRLTQENLFAAGSQTMAAPDLARVLSVLFDGDDAGGLLSPESVDRMLELPFPVSEALGYGRGWIHESFFVTSGHTLGWLTDPTDDQEVFGHAGGGPGVQAVAVWRTDGIVFVWLTNKDPLVEDFDELPMVTTWPEHDLWASVGIGEAPIGEAPTEAWVPVVAHADGVGGSVWRSDVGLLNRSFLSNRVRLRLYPEGGAADLELDLAAGESRILTDVASSLGVTGSAPLRVFSSEPLSVTSRAYSEGLDGTFGQHLGATPATMGLDTGESAVLMPLREDPAARSNLGLLNPWKRTAEVEVALHDGDGTELGRFLVTVPPERTVQVNRPFLERTGRGDIASGYAVVTVRFGRGVVVYGSVVDNGTHDPTTVPMKAMTGATRQWLAAAAHGAGAHGSVWRTDLGVLNPAAEPAAVTLTFHGDDGVDASRALSLSPGAQEVVPDAVAWLGGDGSGWVEVVADRAVVASSRTFNASDLGTYGQLIDAVAAAATASAGDRLWLPQLRQDQRFRTNLGLVNAGSGEARVRLRLYEAGGQQLVDRLVTLPNGSRVQLNQVFSSLAGRNDLEAGHASVEVESGDRVLAYASVIDNATNDPTTVPALR